jgi:CHAT domain-containing protein
MNRAHVAGISFKAFHTLLCWALLALLAAAQVSLAFAQDSRTAVPRAGSEQSFEPGRLGAHLRDLDEDAIKELELDQPHAVLIESLYPEGPADKAGFKPADVVVKVNGNPVPKMDEFILLIKQMGRGAELQLDIWRRGERMSLSARLGSAKEKAKDASPDQLIDAYNEILTVFGKEASPKVWADTQTNLGIAYWDRIQGSRAENLEAAIKAFEAALTVRTREAFPQEWAMIQSKLGVAYRYRIQGSQSESLEAAIKAFEGALTVRTREALPQDWAGAQYILGDAYSNRIKGSRAENIEDAIRAYEAALSVYTREAFPQEWATTENDLGNAYLDRIQGSRAENLEAAIKAYEAVLTVLTHDTFPQDWANAENNLGNAYAQRIRGSRAENLETAVKAYEAALTVRTREAFPQDWAQIENNLGNAYTNRVQGSRAENLEAAIEAYEAALTVHTRDAFPQEWATAQNNLGTAYDDRIRGSRAQNIEAAIKAYEAALTVRTREAFPRDWAHTQINLGSAYWRRIQGSGAENLEAAIKAYEAALTVLTRDAFPQEWAMIQNNLGTAYKDRIQGSRAENLEAAIKACEAPLTVRTREAFPQDWAHTQVNLGVAYSHRIQGSRTENLEAAIKTYEAALTVLTREAFPEDWAGIQDGLGNAYEDRIQGSRAENLEAAIKAHEAALTVLTREAFPQKWATAQNNLGLVYQNRIGGSRAENLEAAIKAFEAALTVRTREAFPQDWASTQDNLGIAYGYRIQGSRADNLEAAIKAHEASLSVRNREATPEAWATTQNNLGVTYWKRVRGRRTENLRAAIKSYEAALTVYTQEALPRDHLYRARNLAAVWMELGDWANAQKVLAGARDAFFILFGEGVDETEARDVISVAESLFSDLAYAQAANGNAKAALATLSEGRALLLTAALRQRSLAFTPAEEMAYRSLRLEIKEWTKLSEARGAEGAEALQHLSSARGKFAALLKDVSRRSQVESGIDAIARQSLLKDSALVAPIVTFWGSKILIVTAAEGVPVLSVAEFPNLTKSAFLAPVARVDEAGRIRGWLVDYDRQQTEPQAWLAAIDGIGPKLWTLFAGKLDAALKQAGVKDGARLIVLPTGALGLLPLELARDPATGRSFADAYNVTEIPSLEAYLAAARTAAKTGTPSLAEAVNPTGDDPELSLPFTEVEGAIVASRFKGKPLIRLDRSSATPDVVLAGLKGKSYWHFASHGLFDWNDARQSGLLMKDRQLLTVGALLDARGTLGSPRLVVLSACETGLYDTSKNPDEFVGLPAAFLELGAGGVIGSLWQVSDLATALLMARFYELHIDGGLAPADALKQAKVWLRTATRRELIAYAKAAFKPASAQAQAPDAVALLSGARRSEPTRSAAVWNALVDADAARGRRARGRRGRQAAASLNDKPFAHPYFWSGFVYTGY